MVSAVAVPVFCKSLLAATAPPTSAVNQTSTVPPAARVPMLTSIVVSPAVLPVTTLVPVPPVTVMVPASSARPVASRSLIWIW